MHESLRRRFRDLTDWQLPRLCRVLEFSASVDILADVVARISTRRFWKTPKNDLRKF